jgi:DNA-binding PadR family transcriptional regulator
MKKMTLEELEKMLEEVGPELAVMLSSKPDMSPERIENLNKQLEAAHPFLRELTAKQMEALLLKVLGEKSMAGLEIADRLEKANIKLKEGGGEGVLYGLLAKLESAGCVRGEWRESGDRMIKIYRATEKGTGSLREAKVAAAQLNAWSESVLSFS